MAKGSFITMKNYILSQLNTVKQLVNKVITDELLISQLEGAANACINGLRNGKKMLLAGNGGSAADAQHIAAEIVNRFNFDRPGLSAIALTTDSSILTAIGNDYGYDQLFSRQIQAHGQDGDIFIAYSTSGKSPNILLALEEARKKKLICIGFTGGARGVMHELCNYVLAIPSTDTPRIQEIHAVLGHILCGLVEDGVFKG